MREWAAESQKLNAATKMPVSAKQENHSVGSMNKVNNMAWQKTAKNINDLQSVERDKQKSGSNDTDPGKNKHLAKISSAFRKSLDPFTKRDVRELIGVGEDDDHIERLEQEHEERRRAHESVFKNVVVSSTPSPHESKDKRGNKRNDGNSAQDNHHKQAITNKPTDDGESKSENVPKNVKANFHTLLYKNCYEYFAIVFVFDLQSCNLLLCILFFYFTSANKAKSNQQQWSRFISQDPCNW